MWSLTRSYNRSNSAILLRRTCMVVYLCRPFSVISGFTPPPPPKSKGEPIFPNVDLTTTESLSRNQDPDTVFVVNGSSRGIGLQFVKTLTEQTQGTIVACCRDPSKQDNGLNSYISTLSAAEQGRIRVYPLDMEEQSSIESTGEQIRNDFDRVDVLLNVVGLLGDGTTTAGPERSVSKLDRNWVEKTLAVNVIGPVMFTKELVPRLAQDRKSSRQAKSIVASLSARVGSISDNELGGWYSYRFSKAALNQATRTLAHELKRKRCHVIALHPGTTDTDLSVPFQRNVAEGKLFPVDFTVTQLLKVIDNADDKHSGGLYDWAGTALPF